MTFIKQFFNNSYDRNAIIVTFVFWLCIILFCILIPVKKNTEKEFTTISIRLVTASDKVSSHTENTTVSSVVSSNLSEVELSKDIASESVSEIVPVIEKVSDVLQPEKQSTPTKIDTITSSESKNEKKESPKKVEKEPIKEVKKDVVQETVQSQQLVKSMEQLIAENSSVKTSKKDVDAVDWDAIFSDEDVASSSSSTTNSNSVYSNNSTIDALSGTAAVANTNSTSSVSSVSKTTNSMSVSVSDSTKSALIRIQKSEFSSTSSVGSLHYTVTADTTSTDGNGNPIKGTAMITSEGNTRVLLEPASPSISISKENEKYIDSSREVSIAFTILPSGQVSSGTIKISPVSLLHSKIEEEIKAQIAKWRFQQAQGSGQVSFKYNIIKK